MIPRTLTFTLVFLLGSCSKGAGPETQAKDSPQPALVARVGKVELRQDDVERAMARDPGASAERFRTPEARRELVDGLVRFELLAQAAEREGLTKDPDAIHAARQIAVTKLVNQKLGAAGSPESISQADVEREYKARQAQDYTIPEASQVRLLRVAERKLAERLLAQAKALASSDDEGFAELSRKYSEDPEARVSGGDLGFIDASSKRPRPLVDAALALRAPGDISGVVELDGGFAILRLVMRRAAAVSPLSSVEQPLRQRLYRERRSKALDDFIAQLRRETQVEIPNNPKN